MLPARHVLNGLRPQAIFQLLHVQTPRLHVFADSGHVPHLEEPDAVADVVGKFCTAGGAR